MTDRNGSGNGTTQFTRSYPGGAKVTLTAPAAANGNTFKKWQKNGVVANDVTDRQRNNERQRQDDRSVRNVYDDQHQLYPDRRLFQSRRAASP